MSAWTGWRKCVLSGLTALASLVLLAATATAIAIAPRSTTPAGATVASVASSSSGPSFTLSGTLRGTLHDGPNAGCPYGSINNRGFIELTDLVGSVSGIKGVSSYSIDINVKKNGTFKFKSLPIGDPNAELNVNLKDNNIAAATKDNFFANGGTVTIKGEAGSLHATMSQAGNGKSLKIVAQWSCGAPASAAATAGNAWKTPVLINHATPAPAFSAVSCPTTSFCAAVNTKGDATLYQDGKWSTPQTIDSNPASNFNDSMGTISCASASFCVAGDDLDDVYTYNGSSWSAVDQLNPSSTSDSPSFVVSCPTTSFCVAVDGGLNAFTYNGSSWSAAQVVDPNTLEGIGVVEVSCASSTFCVLAFGDKTATYNGSGWAPAVSIGTPPGLQSGQTPGIQGLSCTTATFCAGVGATSNNEGYVDTFNGTSWSTGLIKKANLGPQSFATVSCPTTSFCMAPGLLGWVTYNGSAWSSPQTFTDPGGPIGEGPEYMNAVSCASPTFCQGVGSNGYAEEWKG